MERQNISILKGQDVKKIITEDNNVSGVQLTDRKVLPADLIICNADPPTVYREMIQTKGPLQVSMRKLKSKHLNKYSMGLFVLYFGTRKKYPQIAHHTIWLGKRFKALLNDIFDRGVLADDFSLYLHRPTATDSSFAPPGCDSFYALCPVPNLQHSINWSTEGEKLRNRIVNALDKTILPDLKKTITADFWMDPQKFKTDYRAQYGAGFSIAPTFLQSAWFRYHNRDPILPDLYFVGAGTHPGAGMPGVISSAKVVENLLRQNFQ